MPGTPESTLSKQLYEELGASIRGQVHLRGDSDFVEYSSIFNGNVVTVAKAVVCPLDAEDVSKIIRFCTKHSLSPSVKAGGFGTGGWSIGGDIIIDVSKLVDMDIEPPTNVGAGYTGLRDQDAVHKLKNAGPSAKRRREDDAALLLNNSASQAVSEFLRTPHSFDSETRQAVRRRLEEPRADSEEEGRSSSNSTGDSEHVFDVTSGTHSRDTQSTEHTTPARSPDPSAFPAPKQRPVAGGDPFGYLDDQNDFPAPLPPTVTQQVYIPRTNQEPWATGRLVTNSSLPAVPPSNLASPARPIHANAYVTFGAGMRQKEIDTFTANHPLEAHSRPIPYHVPFSAHPVGSGVALLGGFGFLARVHGLTIDNVVEVEMVLADGRIVIVNKNENSDLWWAMRGAGSAFGVVTRYIARAFPVPVVFAGNLLYRFRRSTAPSLIKHFRDCIKGAPRELYANVLLTAGPQGKDSLIVVQMCYVGPQEKGQEYLLALSSWDGEKCLLNEVHEKSFLHQQDSVAQVLRGKPGRQWFIRSSLISSLPDDIINETVTQFADTPVGCTWLFELAGGALADFDDNCLPKSQREAAFTIAALHQWEMDMDDSRCIDAAEEWILGTLTPVRCGGPYPCFLGRHEPPERTIACYGDNWARLCEIKKKYDPTNVFCNSLWPLNAQMERVDPRTHEPATPARLKFGQ